MRKTISVKYLESLNTCSVAIEAAKKILKRDSKKNRVAAVYATTAARSVAYTAETADTADTAAARKKLQKKIILNGIKTLRKK